MRLPAALRLAAVFAAFAFVPLGTPADGRSSCRRPVGHHIGQCRFGVHGTPDLSRAEWHRRRGAEVSISLQIDSLAPNPGRGGEASWPLIDSLGQAMGQLNFDPARRRFSIAALNGRVFFASSVRIRGRGCAASPAQQRRFTLVQVHASASASHGTQAFLATAALDAASESGSHALDAFHRQHGSGCGPSGRIVGRTRPLRNPRVGATAHARLSDGRVNSVDEY
ncbi:MAG: hypothetical protein QOI98_2879, partial [Solirubrobacteraceae bacterium]|nr:hypothetical protein [Solirubrobacteraceae bacterium]